MLAVAGFGDRPPGELHGGTPPVKPSATVLVELDAPIYDGRLRHGAAVMRAVSQALLAMLDSTYRYVTWLPTAASAEDTVVVRLYHDVNTAVDVSLQLTVRGAHGSAADTTRLAFEPVDSVWAQKAWDSLSVATHWVGRMRQVTRERSLQLMRDVLVRLPLAVEPQVARLEVTIPIGPNDIGADAAIAPEFKLHATVVATGPVTTRDPADIFLTRCRSGTATYVCQARTAVFLGDTLLGADLERELVAPARTIVPASLHVWSFTPNKDPRVNGMLASGGNP